MGIKAAFKALIQGTDIVEGGRDILTPSITTASSVSEVIDKNNYKKYSSQVKASYEMYNSRNDYGSELYRGVVDTRVNFIGGEGISVFAKKASTQKYIDKFLEKNKLNGSRFINMLVTGEIEGKDLILLLPFKKRNGQQIIKDESFIKARSFSWWINNYSITVNPQDTDEIKKISYTPKNEDMTEKIIPINKAVYVKLGGTEDRINETSSRVHCILTDIENFSRSKYDLRKNNHLFAKVMPYFQTETQSEAKAINNAITSDDWQVGKGYAGTAKFSLISPELGASEAIKMEMLMQAKTISTTTGIPIHWLAWPELMSNRATAENLLEVVNAGTKKERLIWEEAIKELIQKSMILAIDEGIEDNSILGEFQVKLPLISLANLKALQETWLPLQQMDVISMSTLRNRIPEINPTEEKKLIENEKKENMENFEVNMDDLRGDQTKNLNQKENDDNPKENSKEPKRP